MSSGDIPRSRGAQFLFLARPFWLSPRAWPSWILLLFALAGVIATAFMVGELSQTNREFFDAIQNRDAPAFRQAAWMTIILAALVGLANITQIWSRQSADVRWRQHMTERWVGAWMSDDVPYRLERERTIDNADQRLTDDIKLLTGSSLELFVSFLEMLGLAAVFGWILWNNAGPASFSFGGTEITIPGYLFWSAIAWGLLITGATHLAGFKLARLTVEQQKVDADFRFALAQARENAEQIALSKGAPVERSRFLRLFGPIWKNWGKWVFENIKLNYVTYSLLSLASSIPAILAAPLLLSGEMSFGVLMQSTSAFLSVSFQVAWIAQNYPKLVILSAVIQRLIGLQRALETPAVGGISARAARDGNFKTDALALALPDGRPLVNVGRIEVGSGERVLIRGSSGVGKSTLLRAIAGIWPYGSGTIEMAENARLMIIPQKSYIPDGALKEAVVYPLDAATVSDEVCQQALRDCNLPELADRLHESDRWGHRLSGGEQQRLAFARALIFKPDVLFMDESTSALDETMEAQLYEMLQQRLPNCAMVSVAHRTSLDRFHARQVTVG